MKFDLRFLPHAILLWRKNRLQALLSTLGIVTGVIGLILVIALGTGARQELEAALGSLGAETVIIKRKPDTDDPGALDNFHLDAIRRLLGTQLSVLSPARISHHTVKSSAEQLQNVRVVATNRARRNLYASTLYRGRYLADFDLVNREPVCVVGWQLGRSLFPQAQVMGQQIQLETGWCRIIGWLEPAALESASLKPLGLTEIDNTLFLPLSFHSVGPRYSLDEIALKLGEVENLGAVMEVIRSLIERRDATPGVDYIVPVQVLRQQQELQRLFQYVMLVVAGLMLIVGGVGIMNVMMVNVISRRTEIGLRRAIGATPGDILVQFFTESLVVSMAGGLLGIAGGMILAVAIDTFTAWPMALTFQGLITGFAVSIAIGLIFGSYPALQAASVSPIKSLNQV